MFNVVMRLLLKVMQPHRRADPRLEKALAGSIVSFGFAFNGVSQTRQCELHLAAWWTKSSLYDNIVQMERYVCYLREFLKIE